MPEDGISPKDWNVSSGNQTVCCYMYCLGGFPGGKQTKSRPGYFLRDGERIHQDFIFQDGPNAGKAKGLKVFSLSHNTTTTTTTIIYAITTAIGINTATTTNTTYMSSL